MVSADSANPIIKFDIQYFNIPNGQPDNNSGISGTAMPGQTGPEIIELNGYIPAAESGTISGVTNFPAANLEDLKKGLLYVNLATAS